jgi:RNA-directed DNA polymerase
MDRCHQARVRNALEPEWEARFEPKSYGFRPGRSCQDAIAALYVVLAQRRASRVWVLDADLAAAFDKISHGHLLSMLDTFPARELIRAWLAAGVVEAGEYTATWEGTPQGGVISPLLLNVAMHGLEQAAGVRYYTAGTRAGTAKPGSPIVVRYADDLVALCHSQEQAEQVKTRLAGWLAPRGLVFNETRTRIVHIDKGVNFLGFNIRRYHDGKLLIKPSAEAIRRVRNRLSAEMRALRGANAPAVLHKINPIVRGWAAYYRGVVSSRIFAKLDHHLWRLTYKWASYRHPNKPKKWIIARYFGKFHPSRQDQWVFGDRDSGAYLRKFAWTKIIRHQLVTGAASPDDPALTEYWNRRRRRNQPPTEQRRTTMAQLHAQRGTCGRCGGQLLPVDRWPTTPDEWGQWLRAASAVIAAQQAIPEPDGTPDKTRLIHPHCRNDNGSDPATQPDRASAGLA